MQGFNVLHPFGWDAFGLPAENAAIKNKLHPETWTLANIAHMKGQLQRLGISYAWGREIATCLPDYYRWNQWLFLRMLEKGIAYRRRSSVNWCPTDQTVLANEQVIDGACWRCGTPVTTRDLEQWFLRITHTPTSCSTPRRASPPGRRRCSRCSSNWIGRSTGVQAMFPLVDPVGETSGLEIFTTRIDTIYGATFVLLAPEHPLVDALPARPGARRRRVRRSRSFRAQDRLARMSGEVEKEGVDTGRFAINPFTGERVPIWVANFVLADYGTGAIMAVPFARPARLRVRDEVRPADPRRRGARGRRGDRSAAVDPATMTEAWAGYGRSINSGEFSGLPSEEAWQKMADHAEAKGIGKRSTQYRLKDWGISRQRYWGTPIPVVHCPSRRHRARCRTISCRSSCPKVARVHRAGRLAAGAGRRVRERDVSEVRRAGAPRDGHDGHVRRFVLVLLPLLRSEEQRAAVRRRRRCATGARSTSTAAASSTPSCT